MITHRLVVTMKGLAVFLFFVLAVASATLVQPKTNRVADKEFLTRQKDLFKLFYHIHQPNIHKDQVEHAKAWSVENNKDSFNDPEAVTYFLKRYNEGMVPEGEIFNFMYRDHFFDLRALYQLLYHAKDWDTFYKTACWAREFLNDQLFVHGMYAAIMHRPDFYGFRLPPIYEIMPHYYFNADAIDKAYKVKMQEDFNHVGRGVYSSGDHSVVIVGNYTSWLYNHNTEEKLNYFTEDIGLNSLYYYMHMDYPYWMDGEKYHLNNDRHGEWYYYMHQQLLARYYLERLSNGLGEIPTYSWHWPMPNGYYPQMKYYNGMQYPVRPNFMSFKKDQYFPYLQQIEDYERRIRDAIDHGYYVKPDGTHVSLRTMQSIEDLADMIETHDSPNYLFYGFPTFYSKMLIGNSMLPNKQHTVVPSALEDYQTCLRDPMFYSIYKRYVYMFLKYKRFFGSYTEEELSFPGVKIENVEVDPLVTYFDHHDTEITNAVWQTKKEAEEMMDNQRIMVRESRLNHKAFTVTINAFSEKETKAVFRMFIGPKFDVSGRPVSLDENRLNFFEIDQFIYDMKAGKNTVERNSKQFRFVEEDYEPSYEVYNKVVKALESGSEYHVDEFEPRYGFPYRFLLPKGRKGGMPYYLYVIVSPYVESKEPELKGEFMRYKVGTGTRWIDSRPLGYPFDRFIEHPNVFFHLQNMHFEDVSIFHKKESEVNKA